MSGDDRRRRTRVPARVRRAALVVGVLALVGANAYVFRKEFPRGEQRRNEAYHAGLVALEARRYPEAVLHFELYLQLDPGNPRVKLLLALAQQAKGDVAAARRIFQEIVAADPGADEARIGLAELAYAEQDFDEAFRQLAEARAGDPTPARVWLLAGRFAAVAGDMDAAIEHFRVAVRRESELFDAQLALGDLLLVRSQITGRVTERLQADAAFRAAEDALRGRMTGAVDKRLGLALARAIAGQARAVRRQLPADAVAQLRRVAASDPTDPVPTLYLAELLVNSGDFVEARRTLDDALRRWNTAAVVSAMHMFLAERGETAEARAVLERGVAAHREDAGLRIQLIGFLVGAGQHDDAARELGSAETLFGDDPRVMEARGDLERQLSGRARTGGKLDEVERHESAALDAYRKALALRPRSPRLKKKLAIQYLEAAARSGSPAGPEAQAARKFIEDVLRVNPTDPEALEWRGAMLAAEGRWRETADLLRPALKSPSAPPGLLRLLGTAASRIGADDLAADAYEELLVRLAPPDEKGAQDGKLIDPADWSAAVAALQQAGRREKALETALAGRRAWPDSPRLLAAVAGARLASGDVAGALADLREAPQRFPADAETRMLLAQAYEAAGRLDEADAAWKAALEAVAGDEVRLRYFEFLVRTGRSQAAEEGFLALVAADAANPESHLRLGDFYLAQEPPKRDAALKAYARAMELDPLAAAPLLRVADVHLQTADRDPESLAKAQDAADRYEKASPGDPHVDYLRGKLLLVAGKKEEALPHLEAYAKARPEEPSGLFYLARTLRSLGRPDDALAPLERASRLRPRDERMRLELAHLQHELGTKAFQRGDFAAARILLARADEGGARGGTRFLLAGAAANLGDFELSERECRAALERAPGDTAASHLLAALLMRRGTRESLAEAEALYRAAAARDPGDVLAQIGIASAMFVQGRFDEALAAFLAVYPRTGGDPGVALAIAQAQAAKGDTTSAVKFLEGEAAARPNVAAFPQMLGDFMVHVKRHDEAVKHYMRASELDPGNDMYAIAAAATLLDAQRLDEARALLEKRLPAAKDPGPLLVGIGELLLRANRVKEAGEQLRKALVASPEHPRALYLLGRVAESEGRRDEAKRLYADAVARRVGDPEAYIRSARFRQADGDAAAARDLYLRAVRMDPRNVQALNSLAVLVGAEEEARLDEAVGYAQRALSLSPNSPEIFDTYGWLELRRGRPEAALPALLRAAESLTKDPTVQYHAGVALARMRRDTEARVHFERALRIDPKFPEAAAARAELEKLTKE